MTLPFLLLASLLVSGGADLEPQSLTAQRVVPAPTSGPMTVEAKRVFFRFYDRDDDGFVSVAEVNYSRARPEGAPPSGPSFVAERDRNSDGKLDWAEYNAAETL